jgi:hypothetical protein
MTREVDIERLLDRWLAEGPTEIPDRAITAVADRIERQAQRGRSWLRLVDGFTTGRVRWLVAAAAILIAIASAAVLGRVSAPGVGGQPAIPTETPVTRPATSVSPTSNNLSNVFGVAYENPRAWAISFDTPDWFGTTPNGAPGTLTGITLFREPVISAQDAQCTAAPKGGLGHTVDDFITYLTGHPGLVTSSPRPTVIGGLTGKSLDVWTAATWTQTCPFNGQPTVMFLTQDRADPGYLWGTDKSEHQHLAFLHDGLGGVIVVAINTPYGPGLDALVQEATPIVNSLVFEIRPTSSPKAPSASP